MQEHRQVWKFVHRDELFIIVARTSIIAVLGLLCLGATLGVNVRGARAQALGVCSDSDHTYVVARGDTLSRIAYRYGIPWSKLASHNRIANSNLIHVNQRICIPATKPVTSLSAQTSLTSTSTAAVVEARNQFAYPQCTWWANKRYHQLQGVYVPWSRNADAWQWTDRAYDFGWDVSSSPSVGSIIDLQPWVQGASGLGHVGVVEQVLSNGDVIASSTNWGLNRYAVSYREFAPGEGVTFIRQYSDGSDGGDDSDD